MEIAVLTNNTAHESRKPSQKLVLYIQQRDANVHVDGMPFTAVCRSTLPSRTWFSPWLDSPQCTRASSLSRLHDHTQTHHTRYDSSGQVIRPRQSPLPDNTQLSQETHMHVPGGIRTRNPSKPKVADPLFIPLIFS